jgi:hypothetical protein
MKNMFKIVTLSAVSLLAFACNVEVGEGVEEGSIETSEEAVSCGNEEGVNSAMAALAVAAANEMARWLPMRDFECSAPYNVGSDGNGDGLVDYAGQCIRWGSTWRLGTSPKGRARCPNSVCKNVEGVLQLQNDSAAGMIVGGQPLSPNILRDRLGSYFGKQALCQNNGGGNCLTTMYATGMPVEYHEMQFLYKTPSSCGSDFNYHACKQNTGPRFGNTCQTLIKPGSLKNNLIAFGAPENQYIAFAVTGQTNNGSFVKIDPTGGIIEGDTTTSGSCIVACSKYSQTSVTGTCCTCTKTVNSVTTTTNGTFQPRAGVANWYVCQ